MTNMTELAHALRALRAICKQREITVRTSFNVDGGEEATIELSDERHYFDAALGMPIATTPTIIVTIVGKKESVAAVILAATVAEVTWDVAE